MGGRGAKGKARVDANAPSQPPQPADEDRYVPPEQDHEPEPTAAPATESDTAAAAATSTEAATAAFARVRAAGVADAAKDDLVAALHGGDTFADRIAIESELRQRGENAARHAVQAAKEAEHTMTADRAAQVRAAIDAAGRQGVRRGDYMRLSDLRAALPKDMTRAEVDATLRRLSRSGQADIVPDPDRKSHTHRDHDNGIWIGNENNHLINFTRSD